MTTCERCSADVPPPQRRRKCRRCSKLVCASCSQTGRAGQRTCHACSGATGPVEQRKAVAEDPGDAGG